MRFEERSIRVSVEPIWRYCARPRVEPKWGGIERRSRNPQRVCRRCNSTPNEELSGPRLALPSLPIEASVGLGRWIVALVVLASGRASGRSDGRRRLVRLRRDGILLARNQGASRRSDGPGLRRLSATRADGGRDDQGGGSPDGVTVGWVRTSRAALPVEAVGIGACG